MDIYEVNGIKSYTTEFIAVNHLKCRSNEVSGTQGYIYIKNYYSNCEWYEVYDLIEFIAQNYYETVTNQTFINACNKIFEEELSAYRFVNKEIVEITSEEEINAIEKAIKNHLILLNSILTRLN